MLNDPIVVRLIGILCILAAIFFGRIWWKHFKKHVQDQTAKPFKDDIYYGLSFSFVFLGFIGACLIYFGRFQ